jgi:serine/threonine-protein kinase
MGLFPGAIIGGRYKLERHLGEGGMGVVFRATHVVTRKPVALKFLKRRHGDDASSVQRFLREARAVCAVRHPSVVEVYDVLELEDGSPVMVMELLSGETLARRLKRKKSLSLPELARIMVDVCSAVGCAHSLGIVHRDLKPENIFLADTPAGTTVKVLDFGIAKLTASDGDAAHTGATTGTGALLGTPFYMSPEQLFGEKSINHRADIWALGVVLYEALCGERPTQAENVGQVYKIVMTGAITPLSDRAPHLPADVLDLVSRMLSRDRMQRPADLREVQTVLGAYTNKPFKAVEPPRPPEPSDALSAPTSGGQDTKFDTTIESEPSTTEAQRETERVLATPRTWRRYTFLGSGAVGLAVIGLLALRGDPTAPRQAPAVAAAASQAASSDLESPIIAPAASAGASAAAADPTEPTGSGAVTPPPSSSSHATSHPAESARPPKASRPSPSATPAAKPKPKCAQTYTLDAEGNKIFNPACFGQ